MRVSEKAVKTINVERKKTQMTQHGGKRYGNNSFWNRDIVQVSAIDN